jgi:hypothetical protein
MVDDTQVYVPTYNSFVAFTIPRWHEVTPVSTDRPRYSVSVQCCSLLQAMLGIFCPCSWIFYCIKSSLLVNVKQLVGCKLVEARACK